MRNFEFRGIIINDESLNGALVYGYLIQNSDGDCFILDGKPGKGNSPKLYQVDKNTVGAYTGIRDNKHTTEFPDGQKVYEGDLFYYNDTLRKVVYREDVCAFMAIVVGDKGNKSNFYLKDVINHYDGKLRAEITNNN